LLARGARTDLFEAAALGLNDRLEEELATSPDPRDVTAAFWGGCHGGRQSTASQLLSRGAELNWVGYNDLTAVDAAERSGANRLAAWLRKHGGRSAAELASSYASATAIFSGRPSIVTGSAPSRSSKPIAVASVSLAR
jgi:hypothetical protein